MKKVLTKIKLRISLTYTLPGAENMRGGKRPGAGRKPVQNKRRIMFQTRWNDDEASMIVKAAKEAGLKPSQFIRAAALEKANEVVADWG
ncbi:MAG: DUF1778 domain-containing protein [Desulfuromonadales bacterium]|nr:DUF1778 domain-containing protein [Desulfuromonadales bacterium]